MYHDFLKYFEEQERQLLAINGTLSYCTRTMRRGWDIGNFFYFQALYNPKEFCNIFLATCYQLA
jgi:hypothetical protein